jgi:drug/metabolite transporter (DMT)-like permease
LNLPASRPAGAAEAGAPRLGLPALALVLNAFTWGVSWWPFRALQSQGLHPLWATVMIYGLAVAAITLWRPRAWGQLLGAPTLWLLVAAAGATNACFNWAVTLGDVVRVVLMFYLMPLWAVLLARALLGERLTWLACVRVAMALAGAAVVLWPAGGGLPLPRTLAEWLGVLGGFSFAFNNVMLRREAHQPDAARALAMFLGGALVAAALAIVLGLRGTVPWPPAAAPAWIAGAVAMGLAFLLSNLALQYGASRLPANVTAVVMITEVLFAAVSAALLGSAVLSLRVLLGAGLIVGATLLSGRASDPS